MNLLYFAWVRQKIGKSEEQLTPPVTDVASLIAHLKSLGPNYADAFADAARGWRELLRQAKLGQYLNA